MDDVEQARSLMRKMAQAHRELNYRGVFTYEHAGVLKSIRITHVLHDGLEYERLLYLNGPRREIVRAGMSPDCRRSGDRFLKGVPMPSQFASHLETNYELFLRGEDRVADRNVRIIHVVPKDGMRYGFVLAVDKETGLLLQSMLVGTNRRVMERFQYVDLTLDISPELVSSMTEGSSDASSEWAGCDEGVSEPAQWEAAWLPSGFELADLSSDGVGNASMVYTDGLSFVSVFVDRGKGERFPDIQAQRGATVAQIARLTHNGTEYSVCVVGEVPPETAEKIAQFVTPATP